VKNYREIIERKDIDIVVELMGGYEPARTLILEAIKSGKHVVTANKRCWPNTGTNIHRGKAVFKARVLRSLGLRRHTCNPGA